MAGVQPQLLSDQYSRSLIDDFTRFLKKIALELVTKDLEIAIFLCSENKKLKIPELSAVKTGIQLFSCLKRKRLLSENNLELLIELMTECHRVDLANKVREYQANSVKTLKNAPRAQIEEELPGPNMAYLFLVIAGQPYSINLVQINHIRESLCEALQLKKSEVFYVDVEEDNEFPCYSCVRFQLPKEEKTLYKLQIDAVKKEPWLTALDVFEVTVNGNASIKIAEKIKDDSRNPKKREEKPKPSLARGQSVLGLDPKLKIQFCNQKFDTILAIELPMTVDKKKLKSVLNQCQSAMNVYHGDTRLGVIRFGNQSVLQRLPDQQQIAFIDKELSNDLKIMTYVKADTQCGGSAKSGIADALGKVFDLKDKMRREATKLCILTCFITEKSADLEHYRAGNDAISISHKLAKIAIPLYIIGINLQHGVQPTSNQLEENYFLSGITAATGGRYIQIQDLTSLEEAVRCIIKENNSIERNMGTVNDVIIAEITKQYGDVNDVHLAEYLHNNLSLRCCLVDCITQNGKPLTPISKVSERISWADDLSEAIDGVKTLKEHMKPAEPVPQPNQEACISERKACCSKKSPKTKAKQKGKAKKEPREFEIVRQNPNLEVSARIVRRQIERSAYYRPTI